MTVISIATTDLLMEVIAERNRQSPQARSDAPAANGNIANRPVIGRFEDVIATAGSAAGVNRNNPPAPAGVDRNDAPAPAGVNRNDASVPDGNSFGDVTAREANLRKSFQRLEALIIKQFIETALPKSTSSFFSGVSDHGIWREKMAHVISEKVAQQGSLGIAEQLMQSWRTRV